MQEKNLPFAVDFFECGIFNPFQLTQQWVVLVQIAMIEIGNVGQISIQKDFMTIKLENNWIVLVSLYLGPKTIIIPDFTVLK